MGMNWKVKLDGKSRYDSTKWYGLGDISDVEYGFDHISNVTDADAWHWFIRRYIDLPSPQQRSSSSHLCTYRHACIHTNIHAYIHTHMCTHIHTCIHTKHMSWVTMCRVTKGSDLTESYVTWLGHTTQHTWVREGREGEGKFENFVRKHAHAHAS